MIYAGFMCQKWMLFSLHYGTIGKIYALYISENKEWKSTCNGLSLGPPTSSQIMTWRLTVNYECSASV
ncbi:hypothetical protein LEMLEM_LOCUS21655 [Lemmus lemmus]